MLIDYVFTIGPGIHYFLPLGNHWRHLFSSFFVDMNCSVFSALVDRFVSIYQFPLMWMQITCSVTYTGAPKGICTYYCEWLPCREMTVTWRSIRSILSYTWFQAYPVSNKLYKTGIFIAVRLRVRWKDTFIFYYFHNSPIHKFKYAIYISSMKLLLNGCLT